MNLIGRLLLLLEILGNMCIAIVCFAGENKHCFYRLLWHHESGN